MEDEIDMLDQPTNKIEKFVEEEREKLTRKYQKLENDLRETDRHFQDIRNDVRTGKYDEENEHNRAHLKKAKESYDNFMRERGKIIQKEKMLVLN